MRRTGQRQSPARKRLRAIMNSAAGGWYLAQGSDRGDGAVDAELGADRRPIDAAPRRVR